MFDRFIAKYQITSRGNPVPAAESGSVPGSRALRDLQSELGGATFDGGLYRLHAADEVESWNQIVGDAFPEFRTRIWCFGYDWMGRHFALDSERVDSGERQVLMLEPGSGQAFEIPCTLISFHDEELVDDPEPSLATGFFEEWRKASGVLELARDVCVGYQVPLFLGGSDTVPNLEVIDIEIYWSICGQLRHGARKLRPGTTVKKISIS